MIPLAHRLKRLREENKVSQKDLAEKIGISNFALSRYERGEAEPDPDIIKKLAEYFRVSADYLLGLTDNPTAVYRLDEAGEGVEIESVLRIPVLGYIAAGNPIFADEHIEDWITIPNLGRYKPGELFAIRVKGDSMIGSRIYPGDLVIVRAQSTVADNEIAVVNVDGEHATLKRVKHINGQYILFPDNPKYEPIIIDSECARICGKVIKVMFDL